jgi:hypothetical protein
VLNIFGGWRLEGRHLAPLRIYARHDLLDGTVLSRRIHCLEDEQHRPAVLRVENVLQLREGLDTGLQRLLRPRFVFRREFASIARIYVGEPEILPVCEAIRL